MTGYSYLNGHQWADVTRDERYFCQHLFNLLTDKGNLRKFIVLLNDKGKIGLDPDADWEPGFEVCFYRDHWFLNKEFKDFAPYSPKRTFDLCLFSEQTIVIIEAKAQQGFDTDLSQLNMFEKDKEELSKLTGAQTLLLGLASGSHINGLNDENRQKFNGLVSWRELAQQLFVDDKILLRADSIYEGGKSFAANSNQFLKGNEIVALSEDKGAHYIIGRSRGAEGIKQDIENGDWAERYYQVNTEVHTPPNRNWIDRREFIELVNAGGANKK